MKNTRKQIATGALIIALSVMISRILGIVREMMMAHVAGVEVEKSAYDLAFLLPDLVNHLISTGYLSVTFIPILTGFMAGKMENEAWKFVSNTLKMLSLALAIVLAMAWLFAEPLLLALLGEHPGEEVIALSLRYTRIVLPAQLFFLMGAFYTAVQHIRMNFFLPAFSGVVYNLSIIAGGWLGRNSGMEGFAWGVLIGSLIGNAAMQAIGARRAGFRFYWGMPKITPEFKRYLYLTFPLILGLGSVFALEFTFRSFGSNFGSSGIASLGYAYRMMYTLVAVFGFSIGAASYPVLSQMAKNREENSMNQLLFDSLGKITVVLLATGLAVYLLAEPIISILFERGAFTAENTIAVAALLKNYLWSAAPLCYQIVLLRCFYASERTWLPTLLQTGVFALSLPFYSLAASRFGIAGIPLMGALTVLFQFGILLCVWISRYGSNGLKEWVITGLKSVLVSLGIYVSFLPFSNKVAHLLGSGIFIQRTFTVLISCAVLVVLHLGLQRAMGIKDALTILFKKRAVSK